ncbi:MAG: DNA-directed DNA polymerase II small subunit [Thermoplasmata archaeon]
MRQYTFAGTETPDHRPPPESRKMHDHLVHYFEGHHRLLESAALELLLRSPQPLLLSRELIDGSDTPLVTREMVELAMTRVSLSSARATPSPRAPTAPKPTFEVLRQGFGGGSDGGHPLEGYRNLFLSRYQSLARLLRGRSTLPNLRPIREMVRFEGSASIIGMVREVRRTSERHHLILLLEDETGGTEILLPQELPAARSTILVDEVVGVQVRSGRAHSRLPRATVLERPDVTVPRVPRRAATPSHVLFLSDLHIGSRSFLGDAWGGLVEFLRGEALRPELAESIRHVVIAGDLVDGIGIYPNQERDLAIGDIFEQYAELGRRLSELPARLNVVVVPGNHDAVCPAEPQPALPPEIRQHLPNNVHALGNPSTVALDGVVVEAYHGRSFDDLIPAIPGASYARPTEIMKRMLAMRHLAPMYGGRTPLAPLHRDGLVIDPQPDILVTGHAHTYGVDQYRGILLLNASTWQAETEYQRMRNISPVPARAAVVSLTDMTLTTLDFSQDRPVVETG